MTHNDDVCVIECDEKLFVGVLFVQFFLVVARFFFVLLFSSSVFNQQRQRTGRHENVIIYFISEWAETNKIKRLGELLTDA